MATITITIPDNVVSEVLDAFANKYGWNAQMGINKANFARKKVADYIKAIYIEDKDRISHTARLEQSEAARQVELTTLEQIVIE
jgi:hypothetical protein